MVRAIAGRLLILLVAAALVVSSVPAFAQGTGVVRGRVVDANDEPVADARIVIEATEGVTRRFETGTNDRGEFTQIGLTSGGYRVTAEKEGVGSQSFDARVSAGATAEVNFRLIPGMTAATELTEEDLERMEAIQQHFAEGVELSRSEQYDAAIAKFEEALQILPTCYDCTYNIGIAHTQMKRYDEAEAAFKKTIEFNPEYAQAYTALANVYNTQKRFDEAVKATQEAARLSEGAEGAEPGGSVESVYNQGVIMWNAGQIAEAKQMFERVVQRQPDHADAHYWLGMANLNEGNIDAALDAFEEYVELEPEGQYAEQARGILAQLRP